jgi:hypothetical protein
MIETKTTQEIYNDVASGKMPKVERWVRVDDVRRRLYNASMNPPSLLKDAIQELYDELKSCSNKEVKK